MPSDAERGDGDGRRLRAAAPLAGGRRDGAERGADADASRCPRHSVGMMVLLSNAVSKTTRVDTAVSYAVVLLYTR